MFGSRITQPSFGPIQKYSNAGRFVLKFEWESSKCQLESTGQSVIKSRGKSQLSEEQNRFKLGLSTESRVPNLN